MIIFLSREKIIINFCMDLQLIRLIYSIIYKHICNIFKYFTIFKIEKRLIYCIFNCQNMLKIRERKGIFNSVVSEKARECLIHMMEGDRVPPR